VHSICYISVWHFYWMFCYESLALCEPCLTPPPITRNIPSHDAYSTCGDPQTAIYRVSVLDTIIPPFITRSSSYLSYTTIFSLSGPSPSLLPFHLTLDFYLYRHASYQSTATTQNRLLPTSVHGNYAVLILLQQLNWDVSEPGQWSRDIHINGRRGLLSSRSQCDGFAF
jgi:hypothetical protein